MRPQCRWCGPRGAGRGKIEHLGSAHDEAALEALKAAAQQRIAAGQPELSLGLEPAGGGPLPITSSKMSHLVDSLERAYRVLGFEDAAGGDEVFRHLVLARIIEPSSKLDSLRVLDEAGVTPPSYRTLKRRLPAYAEQEWRQRLSETCAAHARLGPASLVLYDVSTLYFETDQGDGFREPGFSKERRLEPQITIGLLTDQSGFPLMLSAFEGNRAETKTMLPVIEEFMAAHQLPDVTVVADAGMISDANMKAIEAAGLSFILGMKVPDVPYVIGTWRREHPGEEIPDGHVFTQTWPAGPKDKRRDQVDLLPVPRRPRPADAARDRRAGRQGRESRRRPRSGQAQPVHRRSTERSRASTASSRPRPGPWPGSRATRPTLPPPRTGNRSPPTSSSAPTTSSGASRKASGCRSRTCRPGRSTTASATPSRPT